MSYHRVTVFNLSDSGLTESLQRLAMGTYGCQGIEEYAMDEAEVDALLGERSYSGGDLPQDVLNEVDATMHSRSCHFKFYFADEDLEAAKNFFNEVKTGFLCETQLETLDEQDWNAEWKKHYRPIWVEGGLCVLPEWEKPAAEGLTVRIHPGMGFGTGSHETTYLCLKHFLALRSQLPEKARVLDYGSGSGILGLATLLAFPSWQADMIDIDEEAHHNCRQNMELNAIPAHRVSMELLSKRPTEGEFPLVFANILQNILHQECRYLISQLAPGGFLILSGLLHTQVDETQELYLAMGGVELYARELKNDWGCLVMKRVT